MNKVIVWWMVVTGCGGGGSAEPDALRFFLDAPPMIDASPDAVPDARTQPATCAVSSDLGTLALGSPAMPASGNWFQTPAAGPNMGRKVLAIGGRLPSSTATASDILVVELVSDAGGAFPLGTPIAFDTTTAAAGGTAAYAAASFIFGDLDQTTVASYYWTASGSITVTQLGETNGSTIQGSVSATTYREHARQDGSVVADGCTTMLGGLSFNLTQTAPFQSSQAAFIER